MSGAGLPAVRLSTVIAGPGVDEEHIVESPVLVDLPSSNKFSFAWPTDSSPSVPLPLATERSVGAAFSSSEGETDVSEEELSRPTKRFNKACDSEDSEFVTPTNHLDSDQNPMDQAARPPTHPRLSRAFSMPLPSQLVPLRNPRRGPSSPGSDGVATVIELPPEYAHFHELSLELADSVQMVIQTLLQLSPPQVLDPAKEQFSACSLSIPTPSISAMFTSMKNLNYMSANMSALSLDPPLQQTTPAGERLSIPATYRDFDIGEMLQNVGDLLSGVAAQAGVDLVLFHGDLGIKHVGMKGDESGLSYTLSHVIRQIIATSCPGDTIEIGLSITALGANGVDAARTSPSVDIENALRCTFQIAHMSAPIASTRSSDAGVSDAGSVPPSPISASFRLQPSLNSLFLRRLLSHVRATLEFDDQRDGMSSGHICDLTVILARGSSAVVDPIVIEAADETGLPEFKISDEPTLNHLFNFAETLRGRKVTLFAKSKGSFAQHLTSYLTSWGMDVSHVSNEPDADAAPEHTEGSPQSASSIGKDEHMSSVDEEQATGRALPPSPGTENMSFYLIDDDVAVLRERLQKIKVEQAYPLHLGGRAKRPSLANHHRPRSSPQVARVMALTPATNALPSLPPVIVHFTSLSNFKLVKDVIQSVLAPGVGAASRLPEVIVIPKPAGPRRVLTALHTAITKPVVDPFFYPTATSPMSPGFHAMTPFFSMPPAAKSPGGRSTTSFRTMSDKSGRSPKDHAPSSPRGVSDTMEYFSDAAAKLGTSPASGLVIQSPDGQPAGIFFHPRAKGSRSNLPSPASERGAPTYDQLGRTRGVSFRRPSDDMKASSFRRSSDVNGHGPRPHMPESTESDGHEAKEPLLLRRKSAAAVEGLPPLSTENPISLGIVIGSPVGDPAPASSRNLSRKGIQIEPSSRYSPDSPSSPSRTAPPSRRRRPFEGPTSAPSPMQKKGKPSDNNIVPRISVLIVDDNPINQTILSTFMKKKKIKFDVAKNGEEAVTKWQTGGFHLILMDIQMPVMDGIEATKQIRRMEKSNAAGAFPSTPQSEGQRTPSDLSISESRSSMSTPPYRSSVIIVALTASSLQSDRVAALAAGCNDFLTKPVSLHWLNSKIIEWGSIKALQMWADIRPEVVKSISSGQAVQAQKVARRLHVPEGRTPTDSRSRESSVSRRQSQADISAAAARRLARDEKPPTQHTPLSSSHDDSPGSTRSANTPRVSSVAEHADPLAEPEAVTESASTTELEDMTTLSARNLQEHPSRVAAPGASGDSGHAEIPQNGSLILAADTPRPMTVTGCGGSEAGAKHEELPSKAKTPLASVSDGEPPETPPKPQ